MISSLYRTVKEIPMESERLTYNVAEAARLLGLSKNSTYLACLTGQIPHLKIGNRIIIPRCQLQALLSGYGDGRTSETDSKSLQE
jgi:excisionase family DNA binding protein